MFEEAEEIIIETNKKRRLRALKKIKRRSNVETTNNQVHAVQMPIIDTPEHETEVITLSQLPRRNQNRVVFAAKSRVGSVGGTDDNPLFTIGALAD